MKHELSFPARFVDGTLEMNDRYKENIINWFKDKNVWVTISENIPKRTRLQNNFYWVYLRKIQDETGNNVEDLHELFKRKFLPAKRIKVVIGENEEEVDRVKSTTQLSVNDFNEFIRKIEVYTGIIYENGQIRS